VNPQPEVIRSRDNALLKQLRRLVRDGGAYRSQGRVWLEGDHLSSAALVRGLRPDLAVFTESAWPLHAARWNERAVRNVVIEDSLFAALSGLESPADMGIVMPLPPAPAIQSDLGTVVLDRLQDAGNVGSILRCAAAFGFAQVLALAGTVALWSPKVLRAGMGSHFGLRLIESVEPAALDQLDVPMIATDPHRGHWLHRTDLPWPCAWLLGHEGSGLSPDVASRAHMTVRILQPGGEESLNVATAAAICLHESASARQIGADAEGG